MPAGTLQTSDLPVGSVLNISSASGTASTNNGNWYVSGTVATSPAITDTAAGISVTLGIAGATKNISGKFTAAGSELDLGQTPASLGISPGDYIHVTNAVNTTANTGYYLVAAGSTANSINLTPADYVTTSTAPYQDQRGVNPPSGAASMDIVDGSTPSLIYGSQARLDFTASSSADISNLQGKTIAFTVGGNTLHVKFDTTGTLSPGLGQEVIINLNSTSYTSGSDVATLVAQALSNPRNWDADTNITALPNDIMPQDVIPIGATMPLFRANGSTVEIVQQKGGSTMTIDASDMGTGLTQSQARNWSSGIPSVDTVDGIFNLNAITATNPAITFNGDGTPKDINVAKMAVTWANGAQSMTLVPNGTGADQRINWFVGNTSQADGMTQLGGTYQLAYLTQNGAKFGNFSGVSIGSNGIVTALFDNGVRTPVFQIPVATFPNPDGMQSVTGDVYQSTTTSGNYTVRQAGTGGSGTIAQSSLEASTVDLGTQFTTMITVQRAYSAAAKVITTADSMLTDLINIIRQ